MGGYIGVYIGTTIGVTKGDTRSLDYSSYVYSLAYTLPYQPVRCRSLLVFLEKKLEDGSIGFGAFDVGVRLKVTLEDCKGSLFRGPFG